MDSRNAHENDEIFAASTGPTLLEAALGEVVDQAAKAAARMPVVRTNRPGELDPEVRKAVLLRDGFTCQWCRANAAQGARFEVDHIMPWSAGGSNATDNLRTLCEPCNQGRGNHLTDATTASALLIIAACGRCRGRRFVPWDQSPTGHSTFTFDDPEVCEIGAEDHEVPVWCLGCRKPSSTSKARAADVRRRQHDRWATEQQLAEKASARTDPDTIARIRAEARTR